MAITIVDLSARLETDLPDKVLQRILDTAVKAVVRDAGSVTVETQTEDASGVQLFSLHRRSTAFTSVTERRRYSTAAVTLSTNDYRKVGDYKLIRLTDGDNPASYWGKEVVVTYTPEVDVEARDEAALKLCELSINYGAYATEKSGKWEGTRKDYNKAVREVLAQLTEGRSPIV